MTCNATNCKILRKQWRVAHQIAKYWKTMKCYATNYKILKNNDMLFTKLSKY